MKDVEIVVFNDKSWVRFTEYQKLKEENKVFKDREDGFKKQIIGLCEKYHQVYERFPELKDAFLQGDRIMQENEQLKQQLTESKKIIKDLLMSEYQYCKGETFLEIRNKAENFIK